jgi:hypothetical protein
MIVKRKNAAVQTRRFSDANRGRGRFWGQLSGRQNYTAV